MVLRCGKTSSEQKGAFRKRYLAMPPLPLKVLAEHNWTSGTLTAFLLFSYFPCTFTFWACNSLSHLCLVRCFCLSRSYHTLTSSKTSLTLKYTGHVSLYFSKTGNAHDEGTGLPGDKACVFSHPMGLEHISCSVSV